MAPRLHLPAALALGFMVLASGLSAGVALRGPLWERGLEATALLWAPYILLALLAAHWLFLKRMDMAFPLLLAAAGLLLALYVFTLGVVPPGRQVGVVDVRPVEPVELPCPPACPRAPGDVPLGVGPTPLPPGLPWPLQGALLVVGVVLGVVGLLWLASALGLRRARGLAWGEPATAGWLEPGEELRLPGGVRGRVLAAYVGVVRMLEGRGVKRHVSQTAREYEGAVAARFPGLRVSLEGLTRLYEVARFTGRMLTEGDAVRAEEAASRIRRGL